MALPGFTEEQKWKRFPCAFLTKKIRAIVGTVRISLFASMPQRQFLDRACYSKGLNDNLRVSI